MADPARLSLLSRLLSMAVAVARAPVLDCTAVWMQVPARLPNSHTLKATRDILDEFIRCLFEELEKKTFFCINLTLMEYLAHKPHARKKSISSYQHNYFRN